MMLVLLVLHIPNVASLRVASTPTTKASRAALNTISQPRELCARCSRPAAGQCICSALPPSPIDTRTRVLVLQHPAEAKKRIASVPLLSLCLKPVTIVKGMSFDASLEPFARALREGYQPLLLFPGPDAHCLDDLTSPLDPAAATTTTITTTTTVGNHGEHPRRLLVVVDGTWTQARHMVRHSPSLAAACTHVMFAAPAASAFDAVRKEPAEHCMSTLEAVARALPLLEGEPAEAVTEAVRFLEGSLGRLVELQLACVGTRPPRFMDRKRRTHNRQMREASSAAATINAAPAASAPAVPPDIARPLAKIFSPSEVAALAPQLAALCVTPAEVRSRVAQAAFLLGGTSRPEERALVHASLVRQVHASPQISHAHLPRSPNIDPSPHSLFHCMLHCPPPAGIPHPALRCRLRGPEDRRVR